MVFEPLGFHFLICKITAVGWVIVKTFLVRYEIPGYKTEGSGKIRDSIIAKDTEHSCPCMPVPAKIFTPPLYH